MDRSARADNTVAVHYFRAHSLKPGGVTKIEFTQDGDHFVREYSVNAPDARSHGATTNSKRRLLTGVGHKKDSAFTLLPTNDDNDEDGPAAMRTQVGTVKEERLSTTRS